MLVVHGIGNQAEGDTAGLVERAISRQQNLSANPAAIQEFYWSGKRHRTSPLLFLRWIAVTFPVLILLACSGDERDGMFRDRENLSFLASLVAILLALDVYDLRAAGFMAFLALFAAITGARRRFVARLGIVIVPAIFILAFLPGKILALFGIGLVALMVAFGRRNFLSTLPLARQRDESQLPIRELRARINEVLNSDKRLVIVAHSMGAYLTLRAIQDPPRDPRSSKLVVVALGSAARTLSVISAAQAKLRALIWAWVYVLGIGLSLVGGTLALYLMLGIPTAPGRGNAGYWRWLAWRAGDSWKAPAHSLVAHLLKGVSPFAVLALVAALTTVAVGVLLVWLGAKEFRRSFDIDNFSPPEWVDWIECSSVHDSVGRIKWPRIPRITTLPIAGTGILLVDHSLKRYLAPGSAALELLVSALTAKRRIIIQQIRARAERVLTQQANLDDQRDAVFAGLLGVLIALANKAIGLNGRPPKEILPAVVLLLAACFTAAFLVKILITKIRLDRAGRMGFDARPIALLSRSAQRQYRIALFCFVGAAMYSVVLIRYLIETTPAAGDLTKQQLIKAFGALEPLEGKNFIAIFLLLYLLFISFHHVTSVLIGQTVPTVLLAGTWVAAGWQLLASIYFMHLIGMPSPTFTLPLLLAVALSIAGMKMVRVAHLKPDKRVHSRGSDLRPGQRGLPTGTHEWKTSKPRLYEEPEGGALICATITHRSHC